MKKVGKTIKYLNMSNLGALIIICIFIMSSVFKQLNNHFLVISNNDFYFFAVGIGIAAYGFFLCLYFLTLDSKKNDLLILGLVYCIIGTAILFLFSLLGNIWTYIFYVIIGIHGISKMFFSNKNGIALKVVDLLVGLGWITFIILIILYGTISLNIDIMNVFSLTIAIVDILLTIVNIVINSVKNRNEAFIKVKKMRKKGGGNTEVIDLDRYFNIKTKQEVPEAKEERKIK
ncbi:MAG: hypothetical protein WCS56_01960 [Bacilli bacterium]